MPFIGNQPALAYTSFAKQDFTTSATTSYTLDNPVTNENEIALFINFVRQEPTTAYTASGTSLTLTSATSASDDMYCVYLGKAVQTVNPPAGSVGTSQLADSSVTSAKLSGVTQGITEVDVWMVTADTNSGTDADITTNLARASTQISGKGLTYIGTGMTESSGIFTFPSTGIWKIDVNFQGNVAPNDNAFIYINVTLNNSTYNNLGGAGISNKDSTGTAAGIDTGNVSTIIDVTDTSNVKVKFSTSSFAAGTVVNGNTSEPIETYFMFTRLGDT